MADTGVHLITATAERAGPDGTEVGFAHAGVCSDAAVQAAADDGSDRVAASPVDPQAVFTPGDAPSCVTCTRPVDRPPAGR